MEAMWKWRWTMAEVAVEARRRWRWTLAEVAVEAAVEAPVEAAEAVWRRRQYRKDGGRVETEEAEAGRRWW